MAIAFDAASSATEVTDTSVSWTHTVAGNIIWIFAGIPTTDIVTGVTVAGQAATLVDKIQVSGNRYVYLYFYVGANSGDNTIQITASGSTLLRGFASSYFVAKRTGVPDSSNTGTITSDTALTISTTVVLPNSWLIMAGRATNGAAINAGTGTTKRAGNSDGDGIFDSNGDVGTGSQSLQFTWSGAQNAAGVIASFAPELGGGLDLTSKMW